MTNATPTPEVIVWRGIRFEPENCDVLYRRYLAVVAGVCLSVYDWRNNNPRWLDQIDDVAAVGDTPEEALEDVRYQVESIARAVGLIPEVAVPRKLTPQEREHLRCERAHLELQPECETFGWSFFTGCDGEGPTLIGFFPRKEKSLSEAKNRVGREIVRQILSGDFGGDQTSCAAALGVSQPTLSNFIGEGRGLGPKMLAGIARLHPELASKILATRDHEPAQLQVVNISRLEPRSANEPPLLPHQQERRERLANVEAKLAKRHGPERARWLVTMPEFAGGWVGSELEIFDYLDQLGNIIKADEAGTLRREPPQPVPDKPPPVGDFDKAIREKPRKPKKER